VQNGEKLMATSETIPEATAFAVIDPDAYADGRTARDAFAWLRANNPLGKAELPHNFPFWVVTKHATSWKFRARTTCSTRATSRAPSPPSKAMPALGR